MDITGFALVTGASSGIGRACVVAFAKQGASGVALLDVNAEGLEEVKEELNRLKHSDTFKCLSLTVDMRQEDDVVAAVKLSANTFGRLDYVVNAAGIAFKHMGGAAYAETTDWHRVLDINLNGTFYCVRAAIEVMLQQEYLTSSRCAAPLSTNTS